MVENLMAAWKDTHLYVEPLVHEPGLAELLKGGYLMKDCPFKFKIKKESKITYGISKPSGEITTFTKEFGNCAFDNCAMYKNGECQMK